MKGLYLNVDATQGKEYKINGQRLEVVSLQCYGLQGHVAYSSELWKSSPIYEEDNHTFIVAGWFIYMGELNNIKSLYDGYRSIGARVFDDIELGSFLIFHRFEGEIQIFNDLVGLSTHYYFVDKDVIRIAPTASLLESYTEIDQSKLIFSQQQGHLYDNFTVLRDVFRFEPGAYLDTNGTIKVYGSILNKQCCFPLEKVSEFIGNVTNVFPQEERALAISGGLDSRLMLAVSNYEYGYTYGPKDSGDRVIARIFSNEFKEYAEFTIQDALNAQINTSDTCAYFFKHNSSWISGLMEAYSYARSHAKNAHVLFDGYLGDVFQRGTYLKFSGILGSVFKLFPFLYGLPLTERFILRKRYKALDSEQFEELFSSYSRRTKALGLTKYQKITYYETLYGRGGRYIINGGNVTANQLFTDVPVFMSKKVFNSFIYSSFYEAVTYKHLGKVWKNIPERYKCIRTDSGLKPDTPSFIAPLLNVGYRFMLHYFPGFKNYGDEIKGINGDKT